MHVDNEYLSSDNSMNSQNQKVNSSSVLALFQMSYEWNSKDPRDVVSQDSSVEDNAGKANDGNSEGGFNAGKWTDEEHDRFLDALRIYGKNWNNVHKHVGTRSSAQTRSHAQKYFNKLQKKGTKEALETMMLLTRKNSLAVKGQVEEANIENSLLQGSTTSGGNNSLQVSPSSKMSPVNQ